MEQWIRLLDPEPDKELSDRMSSWNCLESCHFVSTTKRTLPHHQLTTWYTKKFEPSLATKLDPWSIEFGSTGPKHIVEWKPTPSISRYGHSIRFRNRYNVGCSSHFKWGQIHIEGICLYTFVPQLDVQELYLSQWLNPHPLHALATYSLDSASAFATSLSSHWLPHLCLVPQCLPGSLRCVWKQPSSCTCTECRTLYWLKSTFNSPQASTIDT